MKCIQQKFLGGQETPCTNKMVNWFMYVIIKNLSSTQTGGEHINFVKTCLFLYTHVYLDIYTTLVYITFVKDLK